jgi:hypothetical protein
MSTPPSEYQRNIEGRIIKVGKYPFNLERAVRNWKRKYPDPTYRRFALSEAKRRAEEAGHLYSAQCAADLMEAV